MNIAPDSNRPCIELVLHGCLGVVFAVALAVMVFMPHVQALVV